MRVSKATTLGGGGRECTIKGDFFHGEFIKAFRGKKNGEEQTSRDY